jgi:hypothetical protein
MATEALQALSHRTLLALLPTHVAMNFLLRAGEHYHHLCHSVGVAFIRLEITCDSEKDFARLQEIVAAFDQVPPQIYFFIFQILEQFDGIEKVKSASLIYVVAVGVLPDCQKNVGRDLVGADLAG